MLEPHEQQERIHRGYEIYALIDPRDNLAHYIGLSISANIRLISHLNGSSANEQEKRWIMELQREGLIPSLQILETIEAGTTSYALACEEELYWIREMARQGHPLLNVVGLTRSYIPAVPAYRRTKSKRVYIEEVVTSTEIDTSQMISADKTDVEFIPMQQDEEVYTTEEIAVKLRVTPKTVREWIQRGELKAIDAGQSYRIFKK